MLSTLISTMFCSVWLLALILALPLGIRIAANIIGVSFTMSAFLIGGATLCILIGFVMLF